MTNEIIKNAGEVAVTSMDQISDFEKKSVFLLRYADKLLDNDNIITLPPTLQRLLANAESRYKVLNLLHVFAQHSKRPVVRHQPNCMCVGADENVFCNMLRLSLHGQNNEAMILGSLLVEASHLVTLVRRVTDVAHLIDRDLKNHSNELKPHYHKHLN